MCLFYATCCPVMVYIAQMNGIVFPSKNMCDNKFMLLLDGCI